MRPPAAVVLLLLMLTVDAKLAQFIESSGLAAGLGRSRHCSGCTLWSLQQDSSLSLQPPASLGCCGIYDGLTIVGSAAEFVIWWAI